MQQRHGAHFKRCVKWATYLRTLYPTFLFYLSNTHNQTVVIYRRASDGTIESVYTTLAADGTASSASELPTHVCQYFTLTGSNGTYTIPGVVDDRQWHVKGKSLMSGSNVLVNILAEVDEATMQITCFYLTTIETSGPEKSVVHTKFACDRTVASCMNELTSMTSTLRNMVGF
tara:strand:- start:3286 stop:3804 length:519 start_codon:yes stop_codon:yes gene_type:complete